MSTDDTTASDLARDTAVSRLEAAPGWYTATLPPSWNYLTPSGGVLMTVALRAMQAEVPDLRPTSATALFCSPVPDGPLEIRVEILRRGHVAAQLRAALSSTRLPGPGLEVSATFTRPRSGPAGTFVTMPEDIPGPAALAPDPTSGWVPNFNKNFDIRTALGHRAWSEEWAPAPPRHARWYRAHRPQRLPSAVIDPLSLPPLADTMPPSLAMALGSARGRFYAPSLDLTVHFLQESRSEWLCAHSSCRYSGEGYATADIELWDGDRRLIAFGTQMMLLRQVPKG